MENTVAEGGGRLYHESLTGNRGMLETIGERQRDLLTLLLNEKAGLTVDGLSSRLQISRNAVRQHLTALERDRLVQRGDTQPSGGRPEQLYQLTEAGAELFQIGRAHV